MQLPARRKESWFQRCERRSCHSVLLEASEFQYFHSGLNGSLTWVWRLNAFMSCVSGGLATSRMQTSNQPEQSHPGGTQNNGIHPPDPISPQNIQKKGQRLRRSTPTLTLYDGELLTLNPMRHQPRRGQTVPHKLFRFPHIPGNPQI